MKKDIRNIIRSTIAEEYSYDIYDETNPKENDGDKKLKAGFRDMVKNMDPRGASERERKAKDAGKLKEGDGERRPLHVIAREIYRDWKPVNYAAKPYLEAMSSLDSIADNYGYDSGRSIVAYFLSNASQWKGDTARRIKMELKSMLK